MMDDTGWMDLTNVKVLFFPEETRLLKHYLSMLRICGLREIVVAERMAEAIKSIVSESFDLIVVTHIGKGGEVSRLLEELRVLDATSAIPVVAIIGDAGIKNALRVLAKGVDEILVEPLNRQAVEDAARRVVRDRLKSDPTTEKLHAARELFQRGQIEQAKRVYLDLLSNGSLGSHHQMDIYLGLFQVNCHMKQWLDAEGNIKKALEYGKSLEKKIDVHRRLSDVFYHYGTFYENRHQMDKAIKSYRTSLTLNPFLVPSIKALLLLFQKRDEIDEISGILKEVQANFQPYSQALEEIVVCLEELAQKFLDLKMAIQARELYKQLMMLRHENVAVHMKVADYFLDLGQLSLVLKTLLMVCQRIKDPDLACKIGSILLETEKKHMSSGRLNTSGGVDLSFFQDLDAPKVIMMAQKLFQQGLLLDPANPQLQWSVACCHLRRGEFEPAGEIFDRLRESHKDDLEIHTRVIELLIDEKAYQMASVWLREATAAFPKEVRVYDLYASYYEAQGQPFEAVGCLKRGLSIQPDHPQLVIKLAELYHELKQYSDSIQFYEKATKLLPNDTSIPERMRQVLMLKMDQTKRRK